MKSSVILLGFVGALVAGCGAIKVKYEGYRVYRVTPSSEEHLGVLRVLEEERVCGTETRSFDLGRVIGADFFLEFYFQLSFWHGPSKQIGQASDIMFAPHQMHFLEVVEGSGMKVEEYIQDIQT